MKVFITSLLIFLGGCSATNDLLVGFAEATTISAYRNLSVEFYGPDRTKSCVVFNKDAALVLFGNSLVGRTHFKETSSTQVPVVTSVETLKIQLTQAQYNEAAAEVAGITAEEHEQLVAEGRTKTATVEMVRKWAKEQPGFKELPSEVKKFFARKTFTAYDNTSVKFFPGDQLPEEQ